MPELITIIGYIGLLIPILFIVWGYRAYREYKRTSTTPTKETPKNESNEKGTAVVKKELTPLKIGPFNLTPKYIGPFEMQIIRIVFSILVVFILAAVIFLLVDLVIVLITLFADVKLTTNIVPLYVFLLIGTIFAFNTLKADGEKVKILFNHVGVMTFWGRRYAIYLVEGDYPWLFRKFGFGISQSPLPKTSEEKNPGEFSGTPLIGERVLPIWHKDNSEHNIIISNLTKNHNEIHLTVTITMQTYDPLRYMLSNNPIKYVADRVRAGIRVAVNKLLDIDVSPLQSAFPDLLYGKTILVVFTLRKTGTHAIHKIVRDKGGNAMRIIVESDAKSIREGKTKLLNKLKTEADPDMLLASSINPEKVEGVTVSELALENHLGLATNAVGANLINIAIGDADLSPRMKKIAEEAAAEMLQRRKSLDSAQTYKEVSEKLVKAGLDPKTAGIVARLMDDPTGIQVSHITSDSGNTSPGLIREAGLIAQAMKDKGI